MSSPTLTLGLALLFSDVYVFSMNGRKPTSVFPAQEAGRVYPSAILHTFREGSSLCSFRLVGHLCFVAQIIRGILPMKPPTGFGLGIA